MNINSLTGVYSGASNQISRTNNRIQSTIASLVSGSKFSDASSDVAGLSLATQLQAQLGTLRQTASNISQALSTTQIASDAIERQQHVVDRLKELATQAKSGALSPEARKGLDQEAQSLVKELNRGAESARFNNTQLLDGTFKINIDQSLGSEASNEEGSNLNIPDLSSAALLPDGIDLTTADGAAAALEALSTAGDTLSTTRASVGSFSQSLDYASATVESTLFNQDAARSVIEDTDFAEASTQLSLLNLQRNAQLALKAQANKLPANVLDLLNNQTE